MFQIAKAQGIRFMKNNNAETDPSRYRLESSALGTELQLISEKCINCKLCQKECKFLRQYGKPKEIADSYDPNSRATQSMAFECCLCQLCLAVCPVDINPSNMFLEMRREAVRQGNGVYPEHAAILAYERRGTSKKYTYYGLPEGCHTILFPGCNLPGTRPDKTKKLFKYMCQHIPSLGIVLDCCTKPSHDLGREAHFGSMFGEMKTFLINNGIKKVFVACPNCYKIFKNYGGDLTVQTVYEFISGNGFPIKKNINGSATIHDPCSLRFEEPIQSAIRDIVNRQGIAVNEMVHSGKKTLCCGEGGSVGFISPEISNKWSDIRKTEANGNRAVTYCGGCTDKLGKKIPTTHILDLLFEPQAALSGKVKASKAPLTYLNRLRLKNHFKKTINTAVTRERTFCSEKYNRKRGTVVRSLFLLLIIAAIILVRMTGAGQYLEQETLRQLVKGYGTLAPIVYMLIYTMAPALFLPGLPITIVGGILFGPFWGVVYTITGATLGACVAFLVSRYIAADWVASKLISPRWQHLDQGVERHGWKIVAFTRLIPLFPFNLLNYAFGLTRIKFSHYAVTTFICMLPACIAFIVFSSSLLDGLKGKISPAFIVGFLLIALVSLIPFFCKRYKIKKEISDSL